MFVVPSKEKNADVKFHIRWQFNFIVKFFKPFIMYGLFSVQYLVSWIYCSWIAFVFLTICQQIVPPVLNSFADQDSRVRYYACEALYNIAKVSLIGYFYSIVYFSIYTGLNPSLASVQVVRGDFIVFFNQIFDALCKLSADSDANVQSAAHLLDRLVKVINQLPSRTLVNMDVFYNVLEDKHLFECWAFLFLETGHCYWKWSIQVYHSIWVL